MIDPKRLDQTASLTFSDEFDSFNQWNGTTGTWSPNWHWLPNGAAGWSDGNNAVDFYVNPAYAPTASANPYSTNDGVLTITAKPVTPEVAPYVQGQQYTSGLMTTRESFNQQYGYFEMRADVPAGSGLISAFWLLPQDGTWPPELDVMEVLGKEPDVTYTTVHTGANGGHGMDGHGTTGASDGYHRYGVDWQADKVTWYLDGEQIYQTNTPADFHKPMHMIVDLGIGGQWQGYPDANTVFPAELKIDYIRVYKDQPGGGGVVAPPATPVETPTAPEAPLPSAPTGGTPTDPTPATPTDPAPVILEPAPTTPTEPVSVPPVEPIAPSPSGQTLVGLGWGDWNSKVKIVGTDGNDELTAENAQSWSQGTTELIDGGKGADRMAGGTYDDVYVVDDAGDVVIEKSHQGIDTVQSYAVTYSLPENVENLLLKGSSHQTAKGNALSNALFASAAGSTLDGGSGDDALFAGKGADILIGGIGQDRFVMNHIDTETDRIGDFEAGVDMLDMRQLFLEIGYGGSNPVAEKYLSWSDNGAGGTDVFFDGDGQGAVAAHKIVTLDDVASSKLHLQADIWFS
jgi:beta-glucanase (GH16 family)